METDDRKEGKRNDNTGIPKPVYGDRAALLSLPTATGEGKGEKEEGKGWNNKDGIDSRFRSVVHCTFARKDMGRCSRDTGNVPIAENPLCAGAWRCEGDGIQLGDEPGGEVVRVGLESALQRQSR